jgi:hypothetical protein
VNILILERKTTAKSLESIAFVRRIKHSLYLRLETTADSMLGALRLYFLRLVVPLLGIILQKFGDAAFQLFVFAKYGRQQNDPAVPSSMKPTAGLSSIRQASTHAENAGSKEAIAGLILLGSSVPALMISYRPSLQALYANTHEGDRGARGVQSYLPHPSLLSETTVLHHTGTLGGPLIVWFCMAWEASCPTQARFVRRLGHATRCNVVQLTVPLERAKSRQSLVEGLVSHVEASRLEARCSRVILGGADLAAMFVMLVVEMKSAARGAGSFAGAALNIEDTFCSGVILVDPFLGWPPHEHDAGLRANNSRAEQQPSPRERLFEIVERASKGHVYEWFPQPHHFHVPNMMVLVNLDGFWFPEQAMFESSCRDSQGHAKNIVFLPYQIHPRSSTAVLQRWDTTEVEAVLGRVEMWVQDQCLPGPVNNRILDSEPSSPHEPLPLPARFRSLADSVPYWPPSTRSSLDNMEDAAPLRPFRPMVTSISGDNLGVDTSSEGTNSSLSSLPRHHLSLGQIPQVNSCPSIDECAGGIASPTPRRATPQPAETV